MTQTENKQTGNRLGIKKMEKSRKCIQGSQNFNDYYPTKYYWLNDIVGLITTQPVQKYSCTYTADRNELKLGTSRKVQVARLMKTECLTRLVATLQFLVKISTLNIPVVTVVISSSSRKRKICQNPSHCLVPYTLMAR